MRRNNICYAYFNEIITYTYFNFKHLFWISLLGVFIVTTGKKRTITFMNNEINNNRPVLKQ